MPPLTLTLLLLVSTLAPAAPDCRVTLSSDRDLDTYMPAIKDAVRTAWDGLRVERGLKQVDAANWLGVSQSTLSKLMRSADTHPWTLAQLRALARNLEVPAERLLPRNFNLGAPPAASAPNSEGPADWAPHIQAFYENRGLRVTAAQVKHIADEAARVCQTERGRGLAPDDLIMAAVLEVSLKLRPTW